MTYLFQNPDGANYQAQAVLAFLRSGNGLPDTARPTVARWHNCREQGYVISMPGQNHAGQINIAFFEHRNSDDICAVEWAQMTTNPPTIENADFGGKYATKWDVSKSVLCGQAEEMAVWIIERLETFWNTETA